VTLDNDRPKQLATLTSNSSSTNLAGLRNKIKIRLSSGSSTVDVSSACTEPPAAPSSTLNDGSVSSSRPTGVTRNLTFNFSRRGRHAAGPSRRRITEPLSVIQSTYLTIIDFIDLFRSFMLHARKDLRDLFDQQLATAASAGTELLTPSSAVGLGAPGTGIGSGPAAAASFPSLPVNCKLLRHCLSCTYKLR